jgi:hypothetical protein
VTIYKFFSLSKVSKETSSDVANLKLLDPAIMQFSTQTNLARYGRAELMALKEKKLAQAPPACQYDPRVIKMNILKYKQQHPDDYEDQLKTFRSLLPNLSLSSWDPKLLDLLTNYQRSVLRPQPEPPVFHGSEYPGLKDPHVLSTTFSSQNTLTIPLTDVPHGLIRKRIMKANKQLMIASKLKRDFNHA